MTERLKWTDRSFNFDFPAALYPEMIERLRGRANAVVFDKVNRYREIFLQQPI